MKTPIEQLESVANFMRGMQFDPSLPKSVKSSISCRISDIDDFTEINGWVSVSDELPHDSDHIIMLDEEGRRSSGRGSVLKHNLDLPNPPGGGRITRYTHWQMMPEVPHDY